jgi:photosystem II stability/assembly factor-like uncharacterized protein
MFNLSKIFWQRILIVIFTSITILGTAASCSIPFVSNQAKPTTVYGVLKNDPAVRSDGFVRANAVLQPDGSTDNQGLSGLSVLKIERISKDLLFSLTKQKGLFKSSNGGQIWQRIYLIPVGSTNSDARAKTQEINNQIAANDKIQITDFAIDPNNEKVIYLSVTENRLGKIYQSLDQGITFKEVYSEVQNDIEVLFLTVDPLNSNNIFAILEKGALLRSLDSGLTWEKVRSFKDTPVQIGFVPEFDKLFFVLFQDDGLAYSNDLGDTWVTQKLTKSGSSIGESQPKDSLDLGFGGKATFGKYEKLIPVTAGILVDKATSKITNPTAKKPWILLADKQIWYSQNSGEDFTKLALPLQSEQANIYDVAADPNSGLSRIIASIDSRLFITTNQGQSWNTQDNVNLSSPTGNISQIIVEKENNQIIYLGLIDPKAKRQKGLFVF